MAASDDPLPNVITGLQRSISIPIVIKQYQRPPYNPRIAAANEASNYIFLDHARKLDENLICQWLPHSDTPLEKSVSVDACFSWPLIGIIRNHPTATPN